MLNKEEKIKKFLFEVNRTLGPVLKVEHMTVDAPIMFVASLCETPYASPLVHLTDAFDILITELGESIIGKKPTFSSTHCTFWFSE